jgi:hypothetical protein
MISRVEVPIVNEGQSPNEFCRAYNIHLPLNAWDFFYNKIKRIKVNRNYEFIINFITNSFNNFNAKPANNERFKSTIKYIVDIIDTRILTKRF